jgi:hypothetical protein
MGTVWICCWFVCLVVGGRGIVGGRCGGRFRIGAYLLKVCSTSLLGFCLFLFDANAEVVFNFRFRLLFCLKNKIMIVRFRQIRHRHHLG